MKDHTMNTLRKALLASAAIIISVSAANNVVAQTTPVPVTVGVQNTIDLVPSPMNFGSIVISGVALPATEVATVTVSTAGAVSVTTAEPAYASVFDSSTASEASIDISNAAPNSIVNVTISDVVDPTFTFETVDYSLALGSFTTQAVGEATSTDRTVDTPFQLTIQADRTQTLSIGATLSTGDQAGMYPSGLYEGSFDVTFNY